MNWRPIRVAQLFAIEAALTLLLVILLASVGVHAAGYVGPPIRMRNAFSNSASFDGCFTDPTNPNPLGARVKSLNVVIGSNETAVVVAAASDVINPLGTCTAPASGAQITNVSDSAGHALTRIGSSLLTFSGLNALSTEVWAGKAGGFGSSASAITVTYPFARLAHSFAVFVYREVRYVSYLTTQKNQSTSDSDVWRVTFNSTRQVLAAVVTSNQGSTCIGDQPFCAYPVGYGGGVASTLPKENNITIAGPTSGPAHSGGYLLSASSIGGIIRWGTFQVNVTTPGASRGFYYFASSPNPDYTGLMGAFVGGPEPAPPPPDTLAQATIDAFVAFTFAAVMILAVIGAVRLRQRFG